MNDTGDDTTQPSKLSTKCQSEVRVTCPVQMSDLRVGSAHPSLPSSTADWDVDRVWREGTADVTTGDRGMHEDWYQRPTNTASPLLLTGHFTEMLLFIKENTHLSD